LFQFRIKKKKRKKEKNLENYKIRLILI